MAKRLLLLSTAITATVITTLTLTVILLSPVTVQADTSNATTYRYVYTKGQDTGECSRNSPCRTIQYALTQANPGDTIIIAGGTYTGTISVNKTITLEGGYSVLCALGNCTWTRLLCNPSATVLDGMGTDRVIYASTAGTALTANCLTISNGNGFYGGGLYAGEGVTVTLSNAVVTGNSAALGGGVYAWKARVTLSDSAIYSNTASGAGGGIYLSYADVTLSNNDIYSNTADDEGGGCSARNTTALFVGNAFHHNATGFSGNGGGAYVSAFDGGTIVTWTNNIIYNNYAAYGGGIFFLSSDGATLVNNTIYSNAARVDGSGIFFSTGNDARFTGNELYDNKAQFGQLEGSGLRLHKSHNVILENNILAGNSGYTIHASESSVHFLHTTLVGGTYGGVDLTDNSTAWFTNTILVGSPVGIEVSSGSTATLQATLWGSGAWANTTDWAGAGTILTGTVNIWGDPNFVDPDNNDYHIGPGSAAINAGVDAGVTSDIDGDLRPLGPAPDIGADEFRSFGIYLPLVVKS